MKYLIPPYLKYDGTVVPAQFIDTYSFEQKESMKKDVLQEWAQRRAEIQQRMYCNLRDEEINTKQKLMEIEYR